MKTILVTGANSGIGYAIVNLFLENDYLVFAHYNTSKKNLDLIDNVNLKPIQADLSERKEVENLFKQVVEQTKQIDVLVNNAGIYQSANSFGELNLEMLDNSLDINLKAPFVLSKKYIELMKNFNYGKIINISSIGVKYGGSINSCPYTISKSALEMMTKSFAKEGSKYNILINTLRVGVTNTDIHKNIPNKNMENRINMIPLKKMAEPVEIAEYVLFISSAKNTYCTGSIITVAGGE